MIIDRALKLRAITLDIGGILWYTTVMKKIIPFLSLIIAAIVLVISGMGLVAVCIAVNTRAVALLAIPTVITGTVLAALCTPLSYMFRRDILCRIAFFIDLAALVIGAAGIVVWLVAM